MTTGKPDPEPAPKGKGIVEPTKGTTKGGKGKGMYKGMNMMAIKSAKVKVAKAKGGAAESTKGKGAVESVKGKGAAESTKGKGVAEPVKGKGTESAKGKVSQGLAVL
jgi:hypothetical protein